MTERVEADGARWALVFIRELGHPPQKVWAALTEPGRLSQWAPFDAGRDLSRTGDVVLTMVDGPDRTDTAATVLRADAPRLLEHTWGGDVLRWELEETPGGTRLTLRHVFDGRDAAPLYAAGWHICADVLVKLLDGVPVGVIRGRDAMEHGWEALRAAYEKSL
ncbi:SRPBCC family protein [Winogradskya consettensis]|uniref:Activator of Hsp90 ATPase homologue 1/2-like C-terminal domain-containing protein n=1 Tax=Winogradskya consettensis TaxID=113560 RepID=A0A919SG35_9ACTN|nr:SRPBCC family protein [Actinoplanes consettensis]GIM71210.1 hypothetical protein Aco04nite_24160 [Actinoplanes consettensis]